MIKLAIVGAGSRSYTCYADLIIEKFKDNVKIVGVYDTNPIRSQALMEKVGNSAILFDNFDKMLDTVKPDKVLITTTDNTHHEYIIKCLKKGYDAISEKPITNTFERCEQICKAQKQSKNNVTITFNCRYMPYLKKAKELLKSDIIGKILSINYEYSINRVHGGSYFKRWHKKMENSQSLLLHKSTHHFDIVNWFLEDEPKLVTALANRVYYGDLSKSYSNRCSTCKKSDFCESYQDATVGFEKTLYLNAEKHDGYIIDSCPFLNETDIYDNMSVSVVYNGGAILTYSLNAFSEREGYNMVITGEKGVMILNSWEEDTSKLNKILLILKNGETKTIKFKKATGSHAGGDEKMLRHLFGFNKVDKLNQHATLYDGFKSAIIGICANKSINGGKTVEVKDFLNQLK